MAPQTGFFRNLCPTILLLTKKWICRPFVQWLTDGEFNLIVRDLLFASNGTIKRIVPPRIIEELLDDAAKVCGPGLESSYGGPFTEMWIQKHQNGRR